MEGQAGTMAGDEGIGTRVQAVLGEAASDVQERAGELLDTARLKTGNLQATLADTLDSGARALRERIGEEGEGPLGRLDAQSEAVAMALESSAMWLRENDLTDVRELVRHQLREHPGRTALIALGAGYLIGRATRR